jgi:hypothetical protein
MGDFVSLVALKDLFARHREEATGTWFLGAEPQRKVLLEAGQIVYATSTHAQDRLTHLLVERGRLTQAQMDYALGNLQAGVSIGRNLIDMGFITQRDLLEVVQAQVERVVDGCVAEREALPTFQAGPLDAKSVRLSLDTPALLLHGVLKLTDREALLGLLGPLDQVPHPLRPLPPLGPTDLQALWPHVDGQRDLMDLSRDSGLEPSRVGAALLFLREMGWARLEGRAETSPEPPVQLNPEPTSAPPTDTTLPPAPEGAEPALTIHQDLTILTQELPPLPELETPRPSGRPWLAPLVALLLAGGAWGAWRALHHASPVPAPAPVRPEPTPATPQQATPQPEAPRPPSQAEVPAPNATPSRAQRLQTLLRGDVKAAVAQGQAYQKTLPGRWTLRLEIACLESTLQRAAEHLKDQDADVFVLPRTMGDGRGCYQLFLGAFASEAEAREAIKTLPPSFLADGNRPRPLPAERVNDFQ